MQGILLITTMAIVVEALVEYGKTVGRAVTDGGLKTALTHLAAAALGIALCLLTGADLFAAADIAFALPSAGRVLTGVLVSRGANYMSDLVRRIAPSKEVAA